MRWLNIVDETGTGLKLFSATPFSASALPFSLEDLDTHVHSLELKAKAHENERSRGTTYVHMDLAPAGRPTSIWTSPRWASAASHPGAPGR